jgi:hypothetical protein
MTLSQFAVRVCLGAAHRSYTTIVDAYDAAHARQWVEWLLGAGTLDHRVWVDSVRRL